MNATQQAMPPGRDDLVALVYEEARLIDEKRFDQWLALFADDGHYWIPLVPGQQDGIDHASLMYEDRLLLQLRIERMRSPRAFSLQPEPRCLHVLQCPEIVAMAHHENTYLTRTRYIYVETAGETQQVYACTAEHTLSQQDGRLKIRQKRVDLLNCDAALPSVQLFM
ncbi:putative benzoate 1,2-dioxygenase, subunit beta [Cupriavidus taiwanensis]|uniref:aromatic-ring-hydroxylating dioxygenase subunit beta n=1 Tax=Cupriavidus taiwanensis TaxID=164546 RepID=UPI000E19ED3D|nr:aromatic-ring-hydroxylating dioxygenase subunit beta [Cupriavidus taiwanensis]SOY84289.1 putative benzoate 1,2-dioxygenase, subunit beta [Cupriavidus taiwanensis]SOY88777.1 putative benzoate 1,2-dioxygenase, subunit beta [Cupriavidus taiwanensis]